MPQPGLRTRQPLEPLSGASMPRQAKPSGRLLALGLAGLILLSGLALGRSGAVASSPAQPSVTPAPSSSATASVTATLAPSATVTTTVTTTATATVTATPAGSITPTSIVSPTRPVSPTQATEITPAPSATTPIGPTMTVTSTASALPTPSSTATREAPPEIYLPFLARALGLAAPRPRVWGTQFVMEWDPARHADNVLLELPRARQAGIGSVRTDLRWLDVEPENREPADFDWHASDRHLRDYAAAGMDALVSVIAYPGWAMQWGCGGGLRPGMEAEWRQFVRAAAERYGRPPYRVEAWEIGNEIDGTLDIDDLDRARPPEWGRGEPTTPHGGCWAGRAAGYVDFIRAAREEILAVDPDARITHGGLAYVDPFARPAEVQAERAPDFDIHFLDDFLLAGGCETVDFFGYHWFLDYPWQPSGAERHARLAGTLRRYGCPKPVWITETFRLTTPDEPDTREWRQVEFLSREIFEILAQPDIERIYWYGWVDFPADVGGQLTQAQRGLIDRNRRPKLGFKVLPFTITHSNGIPEDLSTDRVAAYRFSWPRAGQAHLVAWSKTGQAERWSLPAPAAARAGIRARVFDRPSLERSDCCAGFSLPLRDGRIELELGASPVFLEIGR